ncbi:MFS transporter [Spirillospora sp. CA-253888]
MSGAAERRVVRQVGIAQAGLGFTVNSLGACLVLLSADLGTPPEELAWLSSSFGLGLLVVGAVGRWALGSGPQRVLLVSALAAAVGTTLLATGPSAAPAAAGALLLGLGAAGFVLVTPALLSGPGAAASLSRANAAASVSALFGPPAIGAVTVAGYSGRLALLVAVPALLFLAADARPFRSGSEGRAADADSSAATPPATDVLPHAQDAGPSAAVLRAVAPPISRADTDPSASVPQASEGAPPARRAVGAWATIVVAVSIEFCFTIWATVRLQGTGLSAGSAATAATAFLIGMAAGRLIAPRLIERGTPVVPAGCLLAAAGTVAVALTDAPVPVIAGLALAGLGVAPFYPVTLARFVRLPGLGSTRTAAYGALASGTAVLAAPAALAALGAALDLRVAYLVAVLPLTLVLAAVTLPSRTRP